MVCGVIHSSVRHCNECAVHCSLAVDLDLQAAQHSLTLTLSKAMGGHTPYLDQLLHGVDLATYRTMDPRLMNPKEATIAIVATGQLLAPGN